jgi:hypothetical protein
MRHSFIQLLLMQLIFRFNGLDRSNGQLLTQLSNINANPWQRYEPDDSISK